MRMGSIMNIINRLKRVNVGKVVNGMLVSALVASIVGSLHEAYLFMRMRESEIVDTENIEKIVKDEKQMLGLDNVPIRVEFFDKTRHKPFGTSYCAFDNSLTNYLVVLTEGQEKRGVLRHELYHIKHNHLLNEMHKSSSFSDLLSGYI